MPPTTLTPETINATKAAALLAMQVKKELVATKEFSVEQAVGMTGQIVAALIVGSFEASGTIGVLSHRLAR